MAGDLPRRFDSALDAAHVFCDRRRLSGHVPRIGFLIGGVQKAGTTALSRYLASHPALALPAAKEAHVFDDPRFEESWDRKRIDDEYARHFGPTDDSRLHGDATPIYFFHPTLVRRIAAYNPSMRWIVRVVMNIGPCGRRWRSSAGA